MNLIDKLIMPFSPQTVLKRQQARKTIELINSGYSHHGASRQKKALMGWVSKGASPDEDIVENLETLRERSRDLFMGTPIATGALKTIRTNVVGAGLKLNAQIDHRYLGLTEEQAAEWERNTEREFALWANNNDASADRMCTFGQLQSLAILSAMASGDVFAIMPIIKRKGRRYDLRVSLIEADRVCNPTVVPAGKDVLGGIEIGEYGEAVACYIAKYHPLASSINSITNNEWKRVPMYGERTGRPNVLHITQDLERPSQRRAAPLLAPVIEHLKQLGRYTEAELMAAVVSGMFTVFIKSETSQSPLGEMIPGDDQINPLDDSSYEMGNGAIVGLNEGETIETANPGRPNTAFDGFVTSICRQIGVALELPYELLVKHFTASYSASRGALLEAWKMFRMRRQWIVQSFCQPIYEEWLSEAVAKGYINAPGFFENEAVRAAWCGADWYGPSQGQLDPLKEANAAKVRVQEDFSTREREAAEMTGMNFDTVQDIRRREEAARRKNGLVLDPNTNAPTTNNPDDQEEEE